MPNSSFKYKLHPKMAQIIQDKKRRRQILEKERQKNRKQEQVIRKEKKQYFQKNKNIIQTKHQAIYQKKLSQRNKIRQQEKYRQIRIAIKKSQRLAKLLPERNHLIQQLRQTYVQYLRQKDQKKQQKIKQMVEKRWEEENFNFIQQFSLEQKIKQKNIIDINEGVCILCLSSEAVVYMTQCKHLISCSDCEFMIRMQRKCPVCRKIGNYKNLQNAQKKILSKKLYKN